MTTNHKQQIFFRVNVGSCSLLLIFVILCLISFATLSIVSSNADTKLSNRVAERTTAYYEACNQAERSIADLDSFLSEAYSSYSSADDYYAAVGYNKSYTISISDLQSLSVSVDILYPEEEGMPFYRITSWQVINSEALEYDNDVNFFIQ